MVLLSLFAMTVVYQCQAPVGDEFAVLSTSESSEFIGVLSQTSFLLDVHHWILGASSYIPREGYTGFDVTKVLFLFTLILPEPRSQMHVPILPSQVLV